MSDIHTSIPVCEIALSKLIQCDANVRKTFSKDGFAELAASIAAHGLMQNLIVRPETGLDGAPTGRYEVLAGGRRLAALTRLARQKRIARDALIPCNIREDGYAEELSLAENVARETLHPADQFEAFRDLHDGKAMPIADIAAHFGVTARLVRERLKLAGVSPKLLALYRHDDMSLDQLMAFTVSDDHTRQEEVWAQLSWNRSAQNIRACLLQTHVPADDRRAVFVGLETYQAAGGAIIRDLFADDEGGYLADPALLDRMVLERLKTIAKEVQTEGWKWVEAVIDLPRGHGFTRLYPRDVNLPDADIQRQAGIEAELETLDAVFEDGGASPDEDMRYRALVEEYEALDAKGRIFDPEDVARCGAFVCLAADGHVHIQRGFLRPDDDVTTPDDEDDSKRTNTPSATGEEGPKLSAALMMDLTVHRTAGLRDALAQRPELALSACVHALALSFFYRGASAYSCLEIMASSRDLDGLATGLAESPSGRVLAGRHEDWAAQMPSAPCELWGFVLGLDVERQRDLLAHCISLAVDAVETGTQHEQHLAHADLLAEAVELDMRKTWVPTAAQYLGRVPKGLILEAVRESCGSKEADRIAMLKKVAMAEAAEALLKDKGWLPKLLRPRVPAKQQNTEEGVRTQAAE